MCVKKLRSVRLTYWIHPLPRHIDYSTDASLDTVEPGSSLECCNNNRLVQFQHGVSRFGLPQRVRGDRGAEDFDMARYMIRIRGTGRGSFIVGWSVHNQRIECLWADVNRVVFDFYRQFFQYTEQTGILDSTNEAHIWALHYVFLERIQWSANKFQPNLHHHWHSGTQACFHNLIWLR